MNNTKPICYTFKVFELMTVILIANKDVLISMQFSYENKKLNYFQVGITANENKTPIEALNELANSIIHPIREQAKMLNTPIPLITLNTIEFESILALADELQETELINKISELIKLYE